MGKNLRIGSKSYFITETTKNEIINRWKFGEDNRIMTIAKEFDLSFSKANEIIDEYLKNKNRT